MNIYPFQWENRNLQLLKHDSASSLKKNKSLTWNGWQSFSQHKTNKQAALLLLAWLTHIAHKRATFILCGELKYSHKVKETAEPHHLVCTHACLEETIFAWNRATKGAPYLPKHHNKVPTGAPLLGPRYFYAAGMHNWPSLLSAFMLQLYSLIGNSPNQNGYNIPTRLQDVGAKNAYTAYVWLGGNA